MDLYTETNNRFFQIINEELLPNGDVMLYHGTLTGKDDANIDSFKNGIDITRAKGFGQGSGFYVFGDKKSAQKHAIDIAHPPSDVFEKQEVVEGNPMIITLKIPSLEFSGKNFDIDSELEINVMKNILFMYWDSLVQNLPNKENLNINWKKIRIFRDPSSQQINIIKIENRSLQRNRPLEDSDTDLGKNVGTIFNAIQKQYPEKIHKAEKILLNKLLMKPQSALKYVGSKKLFPFKMEVYEPRRKQWIDIKLK